MDMKLISFFPEQERIFLYIIPRRAYTYWGCTCLENFDPLRKIVILVRLLWNQKFPGRYNPSNCKPFQE